MSIILITGSAGLIGSEAVEYFANFGYDIVGIDNNMRQCFFGADGDTNWNSQFLSNKFFKKYTHYNIDIRDNNKINQLFKKYSNNIKLSSSLQPIHLMIGQQKNLKLTHPFQNGIPEQMNVDQCLHSLFGASKLAADILVQEYGKYFDLQKACL
jgi:CDP-paratose 2-epimerase